jgi:hypothetical protein
VQIAGAVLPIATIALIAFLIVRSRFASRPYGGNAPRWSFSRPKPRPKPRTPAKLIPFDRAKMDAELDRLLRDKR